MSAIPTLPPSDYDETNSSAPAPPENWPTPDARDANAEGLAAGKARREKYSTCGLQTAVALWPTPNATDGTGGKIRKDMGPTGRMLDGSKAQVSLNQAVTQFWPTPSACNANDGEGAQTRLARRERLKEKGYNGNGAGIPLAVAVQVPEECVQGASTSSMAGRPANPLARRVSALVQAIAGGAGPSCSESLASWNPDGLYWRTPQACLAFDTETGSRPLDEYSSSWPRWGTVSGGESGQPQMWALRIDAIGCSLSQGEQLAEQEGWPTPRVTTSAMTVSKAQLYRVLRGEQAERGAGACKLELSVAVDAALNQWPTPTADDSKNARNATAKRQEGSRHHTGTTLVDATTPHESWPTPRAADGVRTTDADYTPERGQSLVGRLRPMNTGQGQLNPAFVESLMGFPPGWLDIPGPPAPAKRSTPVKRRGLRTACRKE